MGYEYIATLHNHNLDVVLRKLETIAQHLSSVEYAGKSGMTFGFNAKGTPADPAWGDVIELSYLPQADQLYLLFHLAPEEAMLEELTTSLKLEGLDISFEEA